MTKSFSAIITKEDEIYVAKCLEVCVTSWGSAIFEAIDNLKEVVELYLLEFPLK